MGSVVAGGALAVLYSLLTVVFFICLEVGAFGGDRNRNSYSPKSPAVCGKVEGVEGRGWKIVPKWYLPSMQSPILRRGEVRLHR